LRSEEQQPLVFGETEGKVLEKNLVHLPSKKSKNRKKK